MSRIRETSESHATQSTPQTFPLAHPPPKSKSKSGNQCLRLSSRLLLQIQQLSTSSSNVPRAVPILELYQPSTFGKSTSCGARKLHSKDMYLTQSDVYTHLKHRQRAGTANGNGATNGNGYSNGYSNGSGNSTKPRSGSRVSSRKSKSSASSSNASGDEDDRKVKFKRTKKEKNPDEEDEDDEDDIVAVIYTSPKPKPKSKSKTGTIDGPTPDAELYFPSTNLTLEASSPAPGHYRFQIQPQSELESDDSPLVLDWEKRPPSRSSPINTATGSTTSRGSEKDDDDRFVLSLSGGSTSPRRSRAWLAQLTKRGVHVGSLDAWQRELGALMIDKDGSKPGAGAGAEAELYTAILTMGVWVARREGW
ncbi:hypothetical protein BJX99DRAFT_214562 [Aspergillus californicus]